MIDDKNHNAMKGRSVSAFVITRIKYPTKKAQRENRSAQAGQEQKRTLKLINRLINYYCAHEYDTDNQQR
ncbi:hypothetical protein ACQ3G7_03915 [Kosakonia oryzendophytica]|uniref:hypothetical protein n=1 Tax=Kosakonia TaxID=1330547 RepID=UPI0021D81FDD|nr:hypothetical protein [Kosakonia sp. ML.JS2a]UXY09541.1 hypothetical protein N7922_16885 [Kosakonia sp. ML.JS2a]